LIAFSFSGDAHGGITWFVFFLLRTCSRTGSRHLGIYF
jgi:hypothetical protein